MNIEFLPSSKETELCIDVPEPAKNLIPDWYKKSPRFEPDNKPKIVGGTVTNNSIKACVPFYDAMISGYIQRTWCDIYIDINNDGKINYNYSKTPQIMDHRNHSSIDIPEEFYPIEFTWLVHWIPKVPRGWSVLMTNPFNRIDLPTYSLSGIVDSDVFYHTMPANYPFYIKKGFSGLIPKGTPMYQILPIKRENWNSSQKNISEEERYSLYSSRSSYFFGAYKRFFHKKKSYK